MKRPRNQVRLVILVGLLGGCASTPNIFTDFNPNVILTQYASYAWIAENPLVSGPPGMSPINKQRIMNAIAANLNTKGYTRIDDPNAADFAVSYTVGSRDKVRVDSYPTSYRSRWAWGRGYWGKTTVSSYTEGRLAIDIFDVKSRQPAWHGWATKNITSSDRRNPGPAIVEAVDGILASFPTRSK